MGQGELRPTLDELCLNTHTLIKLRWAAGFGIVFGTLIARGLLAIHLRVLPLVLIGLGVLAYNSLLYLGCRAPNKTMRRAWSVAWAQILLDWIAMLALVHFTGGITSPALIYFVIHAGLSGMVLVPSYSRALAVLATLAVGGLAFLERAGTLPHIPIPELGLNGLHDNRTYIAAQMFFFGTTMLVLAEMVAQKTQRLRQREERIRQLYEARSTFVRVATHELRAPLAAGLSLVRSIEQGYAGDLTEQQELILHRVTSRLEGLSLLLDDLLTLAATREATLAQAPLEPASVRAVLDSIIEREMPTIQQKNLVLDLQLCDEPGIVLAGDIGLLIIFGNMVNNAVKYTPDQGRITVKYRLIKPANAAEVTVTDTGIGIPESDLPRIFTEFFRASNAKQSQITGTGIGLSTVHALVERYRGTITLDSQIGQGTTIQVTLPLAADQTVVTLPVPVREP